MTVRKAALRESFRERRPQYERATVRLKDVLNALLDDLGPKYDVRHGLLVVGQPKTFDSFYRKAAEKYGCKTVEEAYERVRDLARARVVCHTLDDSYRLLEMLKGQTVVTVEDDSIEDYVASPSPTGYRAIHLTVLVRVPVGSVEQETPCELQIRTALQEAWGHFTHVDFYKSGSVPELTRQLMSDLSDLLHVTDKNANRLIGELARLRASAARADAKPVARPKLERPW